MKKLLFIVCFIFTLGNTNAQTKEETIEWINTNAKELSYFSVDDKPNNRVDYEDEIVGLSNNHLNLIIHKGTHHYEKFYPSTKSDDFEYKHKVSNDVFFYIPIKSILYEETSTLQKKVTDRGNRQYYMIKLAPQTLVTKKENDKLSTHSTNGFQIFYNNEENISRIIKAIMHLAKLNGAKENKQSF